MRGKRLFLVGLAALLVVVGACAPKAAPAPAPTAPLPAPAKAVPAAPTPGPEETGWQAVVKAAQREGIVTLYTSVFLGDTGRAIAKAVQERFGIRMEMVGGASPVLSERVRMEYTAKKYIADLFFSSQTILLTHRDEGRFQPSGFLPALEEKDVWFFPPRYDPQGFILSWGKYWVVPYVNTNLVKPGEEPKSYLDLLKPQWKGKMMSVIPAVPMLPVTYASLKYHKILDVDDYFRRLGQQEVKLVGSPADQPSVLARGEAYLNISGHETFFNTFIAQGAPIKPIYMQEGIPLRNLVAFSLLKEAPHPNAGRVVLNWLFSAEGQRVVNEANSSSPSRKDVPDFSLASKIIAPQAKTFFPQNEAIDQEANRLLREQVIERLLGVAK